VLIDECWLGRRWVVETDIASCLDPWSCTVGERAERITLAEGPAELIEITTGAAVMTTNEPSRPAALAAPLADTDISTVAHLFVTKRIMLRLKEQFDGAPAALTRRFCIFQRNVSLR